jgi:hypothetical protein
MTPVKSLPDFLCFPASTMVVPKLQLQFVGAKLDLPLENNMCIAILPSPDGDDVTVIGSRGTFFLENGGDFSLVVSAQSV